MHEADTKKVNESTEKVEKFNFRVTGMVTKTTSDRLQDHYNRMVANHDGTGAVMFADVLRDIIDKGLTVAEKEVDHV